MSAYLAEIRDNVERSARMFSTFVAAAATAGGAYWLGLSHDDQQTLMAAYPILVGKAPYLTIGAYFIAKWLPQQITTSAERKGQQEEMVQWFRDRMTPPAPRAAAAIMGKQPAAAPAAPALPDPFVDEPPMTPHGLVQQFRECYPNLTDAEVLQTMALLRKGTAP